MCCQLNTFIRKIFKCNYSFACYGFCIKDKDYINRTIFGFCCKGCRCRNLFSVNQHRLFRISDFFCRLFGILRDIRGFCILIGIIRFVLILYRNFFHQLSGYGILMTNDQVTVLYGVNKCCLSRYGSLMIIGCLVYICGMDLRIMHSLSIIFHICMRCYLYAIVIQILINNDIISLQLGRIKDKFKCYFAVCFFWNKCFFGSDIVSFCIGCHSDATDCTSSRHFRCCISVFLTATGNHKGKYRIRIFQGFGRVNSCNNSSRCFCWR